MENTATFNVSYLVQEKFLFRALLSLVDLGFGEQKPGSLGYKLLLRPGSGLCSLFNEGKKREYTGKRKFSSQSYLAELWSHGKQQQQEPRMGLSSVPVQDLPSLGLTATAMRGGLDLCPNMLCALE